MRKPRSGAALGTAWAVALFVAGAAAPICAQTLGVKTGQWSWTITMTGAPAPPPGLPPDVAAKIREEAAKPHTTQSCLTADDLRNLKLGQMDDDAECKVTSHKVTATTAELTRTCTGDEARTETVKIEATSPEAMKVTATRTAGSGPAGLTMVGRWVGPVCREE